MKKIQLIIIAFFLAESLWSQQNPFQDPNLSSEERAKDLISRLSLEEKATLVCDQSDPIPRLDIKRFNWWSEALHKYTHNDNVTVFPEPVGMAASFDDELLYRIFDAVSDEGRAKYNQWLKMGNENKRFLSLSVWTPNVNIFRDPRWGRGQETYSEDPYLTSRMGISVVKGFQGPDDAKFSKKEIKTDESVKLTVPVSNAGKRDGTEIVQVYVHKVGDNDGPIKTLKGFQRVCLAAGNTAHAVINLPYNSFEFYDRESRKMMVNPGEYEIFYDNSSDAEDLETSMITVNK